LTLANITLGSLVGMPGLGMLLVVLDRTPPVEGASTGSVLSKTTRPRGGYSRMGGGG